MHQQLVRRGFPSADALQNRVIGRFPAPAPGGSGGTSVSTWFMLPSSLTAAKVDHIWSYDQARSQASVRSLHRSGPEKCSAVRSLPPGSRHGSRPSPSRRPAPLNPASRCCSCGRLLRSSLCLFLPMEPGKADDARHLGPVERLREHIVGPEVEHFGTKCVICVSRGYYQERWKRQCGQGIQESHPVPVRKIPLADQHGHSILAEKRHGLAAGASLRKFSSWNARKWRANTRDPLRED